MEEWAAVKGYEHQYKVPNLGRVRSIDRTVASGQGARRRVKGHILSQRLRNGYMSVTLSNKQKLRCFPVHRLVAVAFVMRRSTHQNQINHIDHVKTNNNAGNLEWVTRKENAAAAVRAGRYHASTNPNMAMKLTQADVDEIRRRAKDATRVIKDIAADFGVTFGTVYKRVNNKMWQTPCSTGNNPN